MSEQIQNMFDDISGSYDRLNDILSFGQHRSWKKKIAKMAVESVTDNKYGGLYLDCATGTGDIADSILKQDPKGKVVALDFSPKMIEYAKSRHIGKDIDFHVHDIMNLPYSDSSFDAATISFGIRNVDDPALVISEMARVVRPDGKVIVLETGQPEGLLGKAYRGVYKNVLPVVGGAIARNKSAYKYLPESAENFPYGKEFAYIMESTQRFSTIKFQKQSFGVSYIYEGIVK
ncbi:MAG: bifunctional demethylmenaquinone methyltransferase/2-methoxy-6-polyprenyl-1,4-benzoquinol methylase UbiE [Candidatus Kapaibacteriales bacterium]